MSKILIYTSISLIKLEINKVMLLNDNIILARNSLSNLKQQRMDSEMHFYSYFDFQIMSWAFPKISWTELCNLELVIGSHTEN